MRESNISQYMCNQMIMPDHIYMSIFLGNSVLAKLHQSFLALGGSTSANKADSSMKVLLVSDTETSTSCVEV